MAAFRRSGIPDVMHLARSTSVLKPIMISSGVPRTRQMQYGVVYMVKPPALCKGHGKGNCANDKKAAMPASTAANLAKEINL